MRVQVLYFFLLILEVYFNLTLDNIYKYGGLPKVFSEKCFKLVLCDKGNSVSFNSSLELFSAEIDFFPKKQGYKGYAFMAFHISDFKMVFTLLAKVVTFYVSVSIL